MADVWQNIKGVISKVAPILGNAILPGVGGIAGSLIAEVLGVENDPEQINTALLSATPEQIVKLKELEYAHKEKWLALGIEQDKLFISDIQSARNREIEITKAVGERDVNLYLLAWLIVFGFFGLCGLLLFKVIPEGQNEVIYMLFGGLVAGFTTVVSYFFGSSRGSDTKTALLAKNGK